jgi:antitoxin component of MazEF toxin-antitoxin module
MLKRKIIRIGNSHGVTIPPAVLENMSLTEGDTVGIVLKRVSAGEHNGKEKKRN